MLHIIDNVNLNPITT